MTDYAWCFENPKEAAELIDKLEKKCDELLNIANYLLLFSEGDDLYDAAASRLRKLNGE